MNKLRSIFVGALFGVFTFALFTPGPLARNRPTVVSQDTVSHVRAMSVNVLAGDRAGSGVIFHRYGRTYILTAAHVVGNIPFHDEVTIIQRRWKWKAVVINTDEIRDVALLRLAVDQPLQGIPFRDYLVGQSADLNADVLPTGARLLHVGNLLGEYEGSYLEGILTAKDRNDGELDQTNLLAAPGSSGGGVFSSDGRLVGIITQGVYPGLCFFVPARKLQQWAEANDTQWLFEVSH